MSMFYSQVIKFVLGAEVVGSGHKCPIYLLNMVIARIRLCHISLNVKQCLQSYYVNQMLPQ